MTHEDSRLANSYGKLDLGVTICPACHGEVHRIDPTGYADICLFCGAQGAIKILTETIKAPDENGMLMNNLTLRMHNCQGVQISNLAQAGPWPMKPFVVPDVTIHEITALKLISYDGRWICFIDGRDERLIFNKARHKDFAPSHRWIMIYSFNNMVPVGVLELAEPMGMNSSFLKVVTHENHSYTLDIYDKPLEVYRCPCQA